ncbi:MAG: SDR family NAD(P)-dependent oxidoreductase, partial [Mesorhizobium sp.]
MVSRAEFEGRTVVITGAGGGLGSAIVALLAGRGARVVGCDQSEEALASPHFASRHVFDLLDRASVEAAIAAVLEKDGVPDILINNAGVGTAGGGAKRQVSADGYELRFAVNYLAAFLLTSELLPLLKASAPARIVNVASAGQQAIDFDDIMLTHGYSGVRAYCQSKLAQILFTVDLAGELKGSGVT